MESADFVHVFRSYVNLGLKRVVKGDSGRRALPDRKCPVASVCAGEYRDKHVVDYWLNDSEDCPRRVDCELVEDDEDRLGTFGIFCLYRKEYEENADDTAGKF